MIAAEKSQPQSLIYGAFFLFQILLEELCYALKQVVACVCTIVDAMVAVGVEC